MSPQRGSRGAAGAEPGVLSTPRGARGALVMCGMIESNHPAQEGAHMLRKKKSLLDRAVDSASDAVDAARPVIESAVTPGARPEQGRRRPGQGPRQGHQHQGGSAPRRHQGAGLRDRRGDPRGRHPQGQDGRRRRCRRRREPGRLRQGPGPAKVAEVKGEPQKKKGSKIRKLLIFGTLAAAAGFAYNKLRGSGQADNWQSSYTPPASAGTSSTTSATTGRRPRGWGPPRPRRRSRRADRRRRPDGPPRCRAGRGR